MVPLIPFRYENNSTTGRVGVGGIERLVSDLSCWSWLKGLKDMRIIEGRRFVTSFVNVKIIHPVISGSL